MHNTLRILLLILGHIISSIRLLAGQHNFLSLSQFLLGTLMFLIAIEQIKKKDSGTGFICIAAGTFSWIVLIISYIK
ncbi:DUF3953 domain-containing protein [Bacillus thuringiensis]|uniref:DUF3953 domain-containing protein n=1 Tax=Bacillus thuringiensis TaxID=1428 RepID=A0A7D4DQE4_BACTU|nr:DUF3953 domain-containing protein [Bacillus thuringiensis]QKH28091.1 DUF3953 domain-containing protein [Bacillus thuringiensis]